MCLLSLEALLLLAARSSCPTDGLLSCSFPSASRGSLSASRDMPLQFTSVFTTIQKQIKACIFCKKFIYYKIFFAKKTNYANKAYKKYIQLLARYGA